MIIPKRESLLMTLFSFIYPKSSKMFTTYRLPFGNVKICYPDHIKDLEVYSYIIEHEQVHAKQLEGAWGLFKTYMYVAFFPLPVLFSGRWFLEREAYLLNIKKHGYDINEVVECLWSSYLYPWPRHLMRAWFLKHSGGNGAKKA